MSIALRMIAILATGILSGAPFSVVWGEESADPAALARELASTQVTLEYELKAAENSTAKPISAKFEIENGKLQLSVYTTKDDQFFEIIAETVTGTPVKTEKITEGDDLKAASAQKATMAKATVPLLTAVEMAVKANTGFRAVSVVPKPQDGHALAEVTLLQGTNFKKVTEKLD